MRQLCAAVLSLALALPALAGEGFQQPPPFVTMGKVHEADNVEVRRYTGNITHIASVDLVARVTGELVKRGFTEGDFVEEGQVLYEIDPVRYQAAVANAEAKIAESEARLEYAEITLNRSRTLYEQRATSKDAMDSSVAETAALRAALAAAEAQLVTTKDDLANTVITAPIGGKIGVSNFSVGNYVTSASGPIATIIQYDPLRVQFSISNRDFLGMFGNEQGLKDNAVVRLKLADDSVYEHEGKVDFIDNQANVRTDSVQVYASFANPDARLIPGGTVTVLLSRRTGGRLPAVLPSAVMHDAKSAYVYVVGADNTIERREVALGPLVDSMQLVKSGVAAGELVVVDGTHKAMPGIKIDPDYVDGVAGVPPQGDDAAKTVN